MFHDPNMMAQTPIALTPSILAYCRRLVTSADPLFLDVAPVPDAVVRECFRNVERLVASQGGAALFGWCVYVWPRVWIEFEDHCVWQDTPGAIPREVTPRADRERSILFLPHPARQSRTTGPSNPKFSLVQSSIVDELIRLTEEQSPGSVTIQDRRAFMDLVAKLKWSRQRNDPCECGSRKKFKYCCYRL